MGEILSYRTLNCFTFNLQNNIDIDWLLSMMYYLVVQDRIDDALLYLKALNDVHSKVDDNLNMEYLKCYLLLFEDENEDQNMDQILQILNRYLSQKSKHLVPAQKLKLFQNLHSFVMPQNGAMNEEQNETIQVNEERTKSAKLKQCSLSFDIDAANHQLLIHSKNVSRCNVSFYGMNTELLFSINPFTFQLAANKKSGGGIQSMNGKEQNATNYISPRIVTAVDVKDDSSTTMEIPQNLWNQNVFIRLDSANVNDGDNLNVINQVSESDTFYDQQFVLYVKERYGQIQVLSANDKRSIPKSYCKVFAKMKSGKDEFYKDGYTDIRGTFDYVTVSSGKLQNALEFALLIFTETLGSAIKYAKPPKR